MLNWKKFGNMKKKFKNFGNLGESIENLEKKLEIGKTFGDLGEKMGTSEIFWKN